MGQMPANDPDFGNNMQGMPPTQRPIATGPPPKRTTGDDQKLKEMAQAGFAGEEMERKGAVIGALRLYLDFINLFLLLLRVFGRRN